MKDKKFFSLPVMVGSDRCTSSFMQDIISDDNLAQNMIIGGKNKLIVPFERTNTNECVCYEEKGQYFATINSKSFIDQFTNVNKITLFIKEGKTKLK